MSFHLHQGSSALLVSLPHIGTEIPSELRDAYVPRALAVEDTDWHLDRLYDFLPELGASVLRPHCARYVIDLNRPPDDVSLYPGQNTTGLCPTRQFSDEPVYFEGHWPSEHEIKSRIEHYWRPYHQALKEQIARLHAEHGRVLLWEGHSIRSQVPFLFEGKLPDFNIGTVAGASCSEKTQSRIEEALAAQSQFSWVSNGRFKGGYITRHYCDLANNIETVQLELSQSTYMDEDAHLYSEVLAGQTQHLIKKLLEAALS